MANEGILNPKQEKFCQLIVEGKSKAEAYRQAFPENKMKNESLYVEACNLAKEPNVSLRISELQDVHVERHNMTVDDLIRELEEARQAALDPALEKPQSAAAVSATMGKAKLLGLDKQIVDITTNGESLNKKGIDTSKLTDEQLRAFDTLISQASEAGAIEKKSH